MIWPQSAPWAICRRASSAISVADLHAPGAGIDGGDQVQVDSTRACPWGLAVLLNRPAGRAVLSGDYWIGGERVVNLVAALNELMKQAAAAPEKKTYGLTPRELEVVTCIVEGCSNKDVAKQFAISEETVKRHLSNIFDKTGVSTRLELALFAIAHKLVTLEN